jgi:hypothetical protein
MPKFTHQKHNWKAQEKMPKNFYFSDLAFNERIILSASYFLLDKQV